MAFQSNKASPRSYGVCPHSYSRSLISRHQVLKSPEKNMPLENILMRAVRIVFSCLSLIGEVRKIITKLLGIPGGKKGFQNVRIVLSYAPENQDYASALAKDLTIPGCSTPFMARSAENGFVQNTDDLILSKIGQCNFFVLLLSDESLESANVTHETRYARRIRDNAPDNKRLEILVIRLPMQASLQDNPEILNSLSGIGQWAVESPKELRCVAATIAGMIAATRQLKEPWYRAT
jgi:TIR domain